MNFYHNAYNWKGAMMQNLAGQAWFGYGDDRYRVADPSCNETSIVGRQRCADTQTKRQREIVVHTAARSILDVLNSASGKPPAVGTEYGAICQVPISYRETHAPVEPEDQILNILELVVAMRARKRPIEDNRFQPWHS